MTWRPSSTTAWTRSAPTASSLDGDWPVCRLGAELGQWIDALKQIVRSSTPVEQRKLFHDNAAAFYRV